MALPKFGGVFQGEPILVVVVVVVVVVVGFGSYEHIHFLW
jgi:hypothetical protein